MASRASIDDEIRGRNDAGFMLVGVIVMIFMLLLLLSVAAPRVARSMQRERELESARRAGQYVRAIQLYYRKFGHYPSSVEQLEKSNNIRFLRQKYDDPLTGKPDWRMIHVGENKTKVKGFFGEELPGLSGGLGAAAGMASSTGTSTSAFSSSSLGTSGGGAGAQQGQGGGGIGGGLSGGVGAQSGPGGLGAGSAGTSSSGGNTGITTQSATEFTGSGGGPVIGVGSSKTGEAMIVVNEMATYQEWEFLYDPRIEQQKAKASLLGGLNSGGAGGRLGTLGGGQGAGSGSFPGTGAPNGTARPGDGGIPGASNPIPGRP